jgi:hypothetical protein
MVSEGAGEDEFAKLVSDHIFSDIDRNKGAAIVDRNSVFNEFREDSRTSRPGLDDLFLTGLILILNSLEELGIAVRTFFKTS